MNVIALRLDQDVVRTRTRLSMATSGVAHVLVLLLLMFAPRGDDRRDLLTEITLIEPGDRIAAAPAAGPPARAREASTGAASPSASDRNFPRAMRRAEIDPEPQLADAAEDRLSARLAALRETEPAVVRGIAPAIGPGTSWSAPAQAAGTGGGGAAPLGLHRGGAGTDPGPALTLKHGGGIPGPALAPAGAPAGTAASPAPARAGESTARRSIAGALLAGPIADRPVLEAVRPLYPEWAKREAVGGSVTLSFVVRPDGSVRENVLVQKTAGFEDFDESARTALRAWRFAPLPRGRTGEQWGTITFHFRLQEAG